MMCAVLCCVQAAYPEVQEELVQELVAAGIAPAGVCVRGGCCAMLCCLSGRGEGRRGLSAQACPCSLPVP